MCLKFHTRDKELNINFILQDCDLSLTSGEGIPEPDFLDKELFLEGQRYYAQNLAGIYMAKMKNLIIGLNITNLRYIIIPSICMDLSLKSYVF